MLAYIEGKIVLVSASSVVVSVGGLGYKIFVSPHFLSSCAQNATISLHLAFVLRENMQSLYGFSTWQERDFFELLLTVNGIGPKLAFSSIATLGLETLLQAMSQGDIKTLCRVPGIGKKGAERLVIETKEKAAAFLMTFQSKGTHFRTLHSYDAVAALVQLGYSQTVAHTAVHTVMEKYQGEIDSSTLVAQALTHVR